MTGRFAPLPPELTQPRTNARFFADRIVAFGGIGASEGSEFADFTYQRLGSPIVEYMRLPQSLSGARSSLSGGTIDRIRVMKSDLQWQVGMPD